jgi:hypothetical protein
VSKDVSYFGGVDSYPEELVVRIDDKFRGAE